MNIKLNSFNIKLAQSSSLKTKTIFGHNVLIKDESTQNIVKSLEDEIKFEGVLDGLKFPFALAAEKLNPYCFWNIYGCLLIVVAILEKLMSADTSYVLFASPWGFIFDLMGLQATLYGPIGAFLLFVIFFCSYVYAMSNALAKSLVFELLQSGKFTEYFDDKAKSISLKEPTLKDFRNGIVRATLISLPSALILTA